MNTKVSIPLFFHPTTILLIDDNREFLDILSNNIPLEMPTLLKNEALQAYRYLFTHVYSKEATSRVISQNCDYFSYDSAKESFNIDFSKLMEGIETPDRFNTITTVVVDKTMPDLDGILFCQRVREAGLPVKLILLTGTVENQEAVNAFNRRIIDQFIPKTEAQFPKHLAEVIHHLSLQQFRELTDKLSAFVMPKFPILSDEHFQRIFEQTLKKYSIVEYYVLDSNGSFFMADSEGKAYTLLVRTEEDFKESHEMAINSHAPEDVLEALKSRQSLPFSGAHKMHLKLEGDQWSEVMVDLEKLPGHEVFYAVVPSLNKNMFSFKRYLVERASVL